MAGYEKIESIEVVSDHKIQYLSFFKIKAPENFGAFFIRKTVFYIR